MRANAIARLHENILDKIEGADLEVPGESEQSQEMGHGGPVSDERFRFLEALCQPSGKFQHSCPVVAAEAFQVYYLEACLSCGPLDGAIRSHAVAWEIFLSDKDDRRQV